MWRTWIFGKTSSSAATPVCPKRLENRTAKINPPAIWSTKWHQCHPHRTARIASSTGKRRKWTIWCRRTRHFCWTMSFPKWTSRVYVRTDPEKAIWAARGPHIVNTNLSRSRGVRTMLPIIFRSRAMPATRCLHCHRATPCWTSSSRAVYCRNERITRMHVLANLSNR